MTRRVRPAGAGQPQRAVLLRGLALAVLRALPLSLLLVLTSCGDDQLVDPPPPDEGVDPAAISEAVHTIRMAGFVFDTTFLDWADGGSFDASWSYDAPSGTWTRSQLSYSPVYVGAAGGVVEVRHELEVEIAAQLLARGAPQRELSSADRARVVLSVRRRLYATDEAYPLDDRYDMTVTLAAEGALVAGRVDAIEAEGELAGWSEAFASAPAMRLDFEGPVTVLLDLAEGTARCPAEWTVADIGVSAGPVGLDRYAGSFGADAGQEFIGGALESRDGPGRFAFDGHRTCAAP